MTLTTEDVAQRLHITPSTAAQYARSGEIRAAYVGRRWLFTEQAIEDYLNTRSTRVTRARRRRTA